MAKDHKIKADVKLCFWKLVDMEISPPMEMGATEDALCIGTSFEGTIEVAPGEFYEILKAEKTRGQRLLMILEVLDDKPGKPESKEDDKQEIMPLPKTHVV